MKKRFSKSAANFSETNHVFLLFQFNALVLFVISAILFFKQHVGNPIDCIYDGIPEQQKSFVDSYCWKSYEPIVPQAAPISHPFAAVNKDIKVFSSNIFHKKQSNYYRWFPLLLLFQAVLAYSPPWLWNASRDKRLLETVSSIKDPQKPRRRKLVIINLANDLYNESTQRRYAKPFFFCELLNMIFFFLNVLLTNFLFQHQLILYGVNQMRIGFATKSNNLKSTELFPTFAKCSVQLASKEGGIAKEEALCIISFNTLCENIFLFLWLWFFLLLVIGIIGILYRIFMMLSKRKRRKLLMDVVDRSFEEKLSTICEKLTFYSWFTLYRISRNVDPLTFQDIISSLMARLDSLPFARAVATTPSTADPSWETTQGVSLAAVLQSQSLSTIV